MPKRKKLSDKMKAEKPWAILKISRKQYMTSRPWEDSGQTRAEFEAILQMVPNDAIDRLWDDAQADILVEAMGLKG